MKTRADKKGDRFVLNGNKMWITNGPVADTLVVYAKTDPQRRSARHDRLHHRKGHEGIFHRAETRQARHARLRHLRTRVRGLRGAGGERAQRGRPRRQRADVGPRLRARGAGGGPIGIMQACMDVVLPYVHERKQFGEPIGTFQLVQGKIADMYTTMNASRAYVYAVAKACDRGETTREDAAGAILYAAEKATQCALDAIQLLGGNGYINDYPTGRLLRDAKLYEIGAGTSEIRRMLIGRELFEKTA
jgi:isovaleryl-CoA dehydrogenase